MPAARIGGPRNSKAAGSSLQLGRGGIQKLRQVDIFGCDPSSVVSGKVHRHAVVDVEPLRMMLHLLDSKRGSGHEAKGVNEIGELVFFVQLSIDDAPAGQAGERLFEFGTGKFSHVTIIRVYPRPTIKECETSDSASECSSGRPALRSSPSSLSGSESARIPPSAAWSKAWSWPRYPSPSRNVW